MSWIKKIFGKEPITSKSKASVKPANIEFADFNYPPKIVMAWIKALEGHTDLELFLYENGYEEIFFLNQALKLKDEARSWLMNNGYPHFMAFVNAAEGNEQALTWLKTYKFSFLYHAALAIDGENESFKWLNIHTDEIRFGLIKTIKTLKDRIEFNHNSMYTRKDL